MKYCKTCNLFYKPPVKSCLFCNNILEDVEGKDTQSGNCDYSYPTATIQKKVKQTTEKILYFILFISSLACLLVNIFVSITSDTHTRFWSIYIILSCLLAAFIIHEFAISAKVFHKIYQISFMTFIYLVALALLGSNYHWALDYVLPLGLFALNILSTLCILGSKKRLYQYSIYVFNTSLLAFVPLILYFLKAVKVGWPALTCCLYGILTLLGLFVFSTKESKEELKRRLHV